MPGLSVTRKTSASGLAWRSSAKPSLGVIAAMRLEPRSGQNMPEADQPEMRRDDQPVELLVGGVGEREDRPVAGRALVVGLDLDAAHDAVGAGRGRDLEVLALVAVDLDGARQVERDIVAGDLDRFDGACAADSRADRIANAARATAKTCRLRGSYSSSISPLQFGASPVVRRSVRRGSGPAMSVDLEIGSQ